MTNARLAEIILYQNHGYDNHKPYWKQSDFKELLRAMESEFWYKERDVLLEMVGEPLPKPEPQAETLSEPSPIVVPEKKVTPKFPTECLEGTLFGDYIQAFHQKNETCDAYHFAEILTATSALVGRSISIDVGLELYPNFYSILVGSPGVSRKTFSIGRAKKIVKNNDYTVGIETGIASAEGFIQAWSESEDNRCLLGLSELQRVLIINSRQGTSNILPLLTEAYDCGDEIAHKVRRKKDETVIEIENPFLTLIGAITPSLLETHFTHEDFGSGFMSRLNFYIAEPTERYPMLLKPESDLLDSVFSRLGKLTSGKRIYTFDTKSNEIYENWYRELNHLDEQNELIQQCSVRLEGQVPKLACILCWLRDGQNVSTQDLMMAMTIGQYWLQTTRHLFGTFAANQEVRDDMIIIEAIRKLGGQATRDQIRQATKTKMSSEKRNRILAAMSGNDLELTEVKTKGRPKKVYQLRK